MKKTSKTVIVTGGNRGIGESIARAFCEQGCRVLVGARTDTGLTKKLGKRVHFCSIDVRREEDHMGLVKFAIDWTGRLDVYINCAGFSRWSPVEQVDDKFWDEMIDTNLKGTFWGCKAAARALKKGGCIINISSLAGKRGSANNSVYCASKFGVNGITQSLAKELGPKGIRVNAVCPVYVKTPGVIKALEEGSSPAQGKKVEVYLNKFIADNAALKRLPTGIEVARLCLFLTSDASSAITGQCINLDCGVNPQ
jgi:3-oxoacyl-[acyl-carrier protein] reductase/meso-butanediol dehydrogenase/(S,S)-butanediol dehydrogenase/diacetyl reductase